MLIFMRLCALLFLVFLVCFMLTLVLRKIVDLID